MFGLIRKSVFDTKIAQYEQTIEAYKDEVAKLKKLIPEKKYTGLTSGFHGPVTVTTDGSRKNEIWKTIPGTDWKVSNYCRFKDSRGRLSSQTYKAWSDKRALNTMQITSHGKKSICYSDVAIMVHTFNPQTFHLGRYCDKNLKFRDGNPSNKYLSNIIF